MAWPDRIAVVGAGYMGRGIAQVFAQAGIPCTLADISAERAAAAVELLVADAARHESDGLVPPGSSAEARSQLLAADSVADAVSGADYVVESVFEDRGVKVDALMQIDAA